jgi:muconolactone delta-isomerase
MGIKMPKMRFLVIQKPKDEVVGTTPPGEMIEHVLRHMEYFRELKEKGIVIEDGAFAGVRGGFGIFEVESLEELNSILNHAPAMPYMHTEIYPLVSRDTRVKQLEEQLRKLRQKLEVYA